MKAAVIYENGGPEKLQIAEIPAPAPKAGEALIEVRAAALNHLDIWVRKGRPGVTMNFPHPLGSDAAGVVTAVGANVDTVSVGDEVILNPGLWCGRCEYCLRGEHSECPSYGIIGLSRPGVFAQQTTVPAVCVHPKPARLSWEEAAALPLAYLTAWRMLMTRARLIPGETVLIHGIGGGVAVAALQLARLAGARAIVTSSSDEKLKRAEQLGAWKGVNYRTGGDVAKTVREITGGRGVDVAIDTTGSATWPINFAALRRGGRAVHCGVTTGAEVPVNISALYWNHLTVMGSTMGSNEEFRQLLEATEAADLRPVIDSVYPLADTAKAMARMEAGEQFGKIVLAPVS